MIACSTDSNTWTDVYTNTAGDGGVDQVILTPPVNARYVKLQGIQRATGWGYSLYEMQVFGHLQDTDFDGLNDAWELDRFGTLAWSGLDDPDCDGINNANEQCVPLGRSHPQSGYCEFLKANEPLLSAARNIFQRLTRCNCAIWASVALCSWICVYASRTEKTS